jgi:drug/metabolite transporter (DMT)-like permease
MLIALSLLAALGYGLSDFVGGIAARRLRPTTALRYGVPAGALVVVLLLPLSSGHLTLRAIGLAAAAGVAGLVGLALMYRLMASEPLNVVSPVTAVLAAATPLAFGVASGEHPDSSAWFGVATGLLGIALITGKRSTAAPAGLRLRVLLMALGAGAGFGAYFVLIAHAGHGSGLWPLLVARATALLVLVPLAGRPARLQSPPGRHRLPAVLAGALDAGADAFFLLASHAGYLSLAGVITALYPAVTVLLAVLVLRERPGWLPGAGLALSAVSLALIMQ